MSDEHGDDLEQFRELERPAAKAVGLKPGSISIATPPAGMLYIAGEQHGPRWQAEMRRLATECGERGALADARRFQTLHGAVKSSLGLPGAKR